MKNVIIFILLSILSAGILFGVLPTNYAGGVSNKWFALEFELVKLLLQLVVAGVIGKILVDTYNAGREKEKAANQFRKDLLQELVKAYYKAKRVRRILRGNTITEKGTKKINHKVYEEQMRDIIDAQLALEYHKFQLKSFPKSFKNTICPLIIEADKLEKYLGDLITEYEELGEAGEFIHVTNLTKLKDFFDKDEFKLGFAKHFHSSVKLIGLEILGFKQELNEILKKDSLLTYTK